MSAWTRITAAFSAALAPRDAHAPPLVSAAVDAPPPAPVPTSAMGGEVRGDTWMSSQLGLGTLGYDKRQRTHFKIRTVLARNPRLVRELMRGDSIFRKVIIKQVSLAFGGGLDWTVEAEEGQDTTAATDALTDELKRLRAEHWVKTGRIWGRALGGSLLVANCDDGLDPSEPLSLETLTEVVHLRKVDATHAQIELDQSGGARHGLPDFYTIQGASMGSRVRIHHTRVYHFPGQATDDETKAELGGWDDSAGQAVYESIRDFVSGVGSLSSQLQDAVQPVYKIRGLSDALRAGNLSFVRNWIQSVEMFRSAIRAIGLDADDEDFGYKSRPLGDSTTLLYALMHVVAGVADMPVTELFQMAPAGLSTDDGAGRTRWYDKIDAEERQGPPAEALDWIARLLTHQSAVPELLGHTVSYQWAPLEKENPQEVATTRKTDAETDTLNISSGVYTPRQIAELRATEDGVTLPEATVLEEGRLSDNDRLIQMRLGRDVFYDPVMGPAFAATLGLDPPTAKQIADYQASTSASTSAPATTEGGT